MPRQGFLARAWYAIGRLAASFGFGGQPEEGAAADEPEVGELRGFVLGQPRLHGEAPEAPRLLGLTHARSTYVVGLASGAAPFSCEVGHPRLVGALVQPELSGRVLLLLPG